MIKKLKQNEKLLKILSMVFNAIILILKIAFALFCIYVIIRMYQKAGETADSGKENIYYAGFSSFVVVFLGLGAFFCIVWSVFSIVTIIVGAVSRFSKTYTTLSLFDGIMGAIIIVPLFETLIADVASERFNIFSFILISMIIVLLAIHLFIQILIYKVISRKRDEKKEIEDVSNNIE